MDMKKTGAFLAQLRREHGLTQEQLGEQLGVTNKTISRWETGNYMPPVDILQRLSGLYGVSINELLSGQRLEEAEYRSRAEENIKSALEQSSFTINERIAFFKRKWKKDHLWSTVIFCILMAGLFILGWNNRDLQPNVLVPVLTTVFCVIRHNVMMAYVEGKVFDMPDTTRQDEAAKQHLLYLRRLQVGLLILFALSCILTVALGTDFFYSLVPEVGDGVTVHSLLSHLVYGDSWSRQRFLEGFLTSLDASLILLLCNVGLLLWRMKKEK